MAIITRNNLQVTHHSPPHRTFPKSSSSTSTTANHIRFSRNNQISTTTTIIKSPRAMMPGITQDKNSATQYGMISTGNTYPCSYSRGSPPPARLHFQTVITVTVGPDKIPFLVHRERFCAASPFFAAALNPNYNFKESGLRTVSLPFARPIDFEYLVQWIYTHNLDHEELDIVSHPAYFRLIRLWLLADELQVEGCLNAIVDKMARVADRSNSVPTPDDTRTVFGEDG
ncbi:MAG: hypothetical protein Q9170_001166, partial [Blastenia crenularia]